LNNRDKHHQARLVRRGLFAAVLALTMAAASGPIRAEDSRPAAAAVCAACHGEDGNSLVPMFPKLAGQHEEYLVKQLRDFMSGRRKSDVMGPIVADLKAADVATLAAYFSRQKMKPGAPEDKKLVGLGKLIFFDGNEESGVPACVGCHQPQGAGHDSYPRIGGQQMVYMVQQLRNFAAGDRSNDVSRYMRVTAKRMTDEEIRAVAEYLVGLDAK